MAVRRTRLSPEDKKSLEDMARERGIDTSARDDTKQYKMMAEARKREMAEALAQKKLAA
jgi:hypothetical protein